MGINEVIAVIGIFITIIGAMLTFYSWIKVKIKELEMSIIELKDRMNDNEKNIKLVDDKIDIKLDKLTEKTSEILSKMNDIRVNCAAYNHTNKI